MTARRATAVAGVLVVVLAGCAGDSTDSPSPTPDASSSSTEPSPSETSPSATGAEPTAVPSPTASPTASESANPVPVPVQPAVWPAPGVVLDDPVEAASDFVSTVFGVPPNLGEFQQGDARSGEIEVLSPVETGGTSIRSVLLLRQLGPDDGWFVLAAVSDINTIDAPRSGSEVPAGPVEVSGEGRGFEGLLVVEAWPAGAGPRLDQQTAQGGSMEPTEPYAVTLDLSEATSGGTVVLLVRGGVGLETDTGEFSAIPVTMG